MSSTSITNGIIFDPFALHSVGVQRKFRVRGRTVGNFKEMLFDGLHNEAKFKRAFINACHYAESMTVIGPVANIAWDSLDHYRPIEDALRWPVDLSHPDNRTQRVLCDEIAKLGIDLDSMYTASNNTFHLNPIADMLDHYMAPDAGIDPVDSQAQWLDALRTYSGRKFFDSVMADGTNAPMLGLMAVAFTFKKPTGYRAVTELTNLGHFPPVVFLIPTMVPSKVSTQREILFDEPMISTYTISLGDWSEERIYTYASPFDFLSVDTQGKTPDILRSLSDVFSAMWSQATLYSAWNMELDDDLKMGKMYLEPMGAGRRIRGHNRFKNIYELLSAAHTSCDYDAHYGEFKPEVLYKSQGNMAMVAKLMREQASQARKAMQHRGMDDLNTIFVLPSYFSGGRGAGGLVEGFFPLALTLMGTLFNNGNIYGAAEDESNAFESLMCGATLGGRGNAQPVPGLMERISGMDVNNGDARTINRVAASIKFNEEGTPRIFRLKVPDRHTHTLQEATNKSLTVADSEVDSLVIDTDKSENFNFMDAFCAQSPKDLGQAFKAVKAPPKSGKRKKSLVEKEETVNLFDNDSLL